MVGRRQRPAGYLSIVSKRREGGGVGGGGGDDIMVLISVRLD